jgi:transposase-like protein
MGELKNQKELWRERIRNHQRSGLSVKEYCQRHDLGEGAYFYWKRKLTKDQGLVEVKLSSSAPTPVEIILRNQIRVRLAFSCDLGEVVKLSRELETL